MEDTREYARLPVVSVRNAGKSYSGNERKILDNFSMTVESGTIYGLLGSSGCGKTTALKCILGLSFLQEGVIHVFGKKPGSRGSSVPGNSVGYMPQDYALVGILSIAETLLYYGTLFGMSGKDIKDRIQVVTQFLKLPERNSRVANLSGGQQRRVSLAVALIHSPKLLILDEPTVGVDPLLRERIWEHLVDIVQTNGSTVIITTHYIEEARHSQKIGIMRNGRLIAENDPNSILQRYSVKLLGDAVLEICRQEESIENEGDKRRRSSIQKLKDFFTDDLSQAVDDVSEWRPSSAKDSCQRFKAIILRNLLVMYRNIFMVFFMVLTPAVMVVLVCCSYGTDPTAPLDIGIVNYEVANSKVNPCNFTQIQNGVCDLTFLSCKYLDQIPADKIRFTFYPSTETAFAGVESGEVWGYLLIPDSFSSHVGSRFVKGVNWIEQGLNGSSMWYQFDASNTAVSGHLEKLLRSSFYSFISNILSNCGLNPATVGLPVQLREAVYGESEGRFAEFIGPSVLSTFIFFMPLCSVSAQYIIDKKSGIVERTRAAGVNTSEIMGSYIITEGILIFLQILSNMAILSWVFDIEIRGSVMLCVVTFMGIGVSGLSAGFALSTICSQEHEAVVIALGGFPPLCFLSGVWWPIQGMPLFLQYVGYALPSNLPAETVRSIISRGWGLNHVNVWGGLTILVGWIAIFWGLTVFAHWFTLRRK